VARKVAWGIDIGESAIKAVRLRRAGDAVVVQDYRTIPCEARIEEAAAGDKEFRIRNAVATLQREVKLKGTTVAVSIPGHDVFPRFIPLPPVEKKRIPEIVRYEARTQMPFPIEEVVWDYQPVTGYDVPGEEVEVALFAIKKATVYGFLTNLRLGGLAPDLVEITPLALYNFLIYDRDVDTGTVVIDVGAGNTDLVIIDGERFWTRNVSISGNDITRALQEKYQISFEEAESLKLKAASSKQAEKLFGAMRPIVDDLLGEIQRSIGYYKAQTRNVRIENVVLLGNAFKLNGLVDYFRKNLDYNVSLLSSIERVQMAGSSDTEKFEPELPNYAVAIGLGIQALGLARVNIDMMPGDIVRERLLRQKIPYAAAMVALLALPPLFGYRSASREIKRCGKEIVPVETEIKKHQATLDAERRARDLGKVGEEMARLETIGAKRWEWLLFFDNLNRALSEIRRDQFLLHSVSEVTDADAAAGSRRHAASSRRRRSSKKEEEGQEQGPAGLKIAVRFQKTDTFSANDVRSLSELLEKQPYVRAVEGRDQERADDPRGGAASSATDGADAGLRGWVYTFWVTFNTESEADKAAKATAAKKKTAGSPGSASKGIPGLPPMPSGR